MMLISNHILSDIVNTIHIKFESELKYENKYNIGDIRSVFVPGAHLLPLASVPGLQNEHAQVPTPTKTSTA
jgi:hypothetical protein